MFDRSHILRTAWADYRRDERKGWGVRRGGPFDRKHFAYCLRMAWAVAKSKAARSAAVPQVAPAKVCINPDRASEIRSELQDMEFGDFIDWNRRGALDAELAQLHA